MRAILKITVCGGGPGIRNTRVSIMCLFCLPEQFLYFQEFILFCIKFYNPLSQDTDS